MKLDEEVKRLTELLEEMPALGMRALGSPGAPVFVLDFIVAGAVKRTLSLGHGLLTMIDAKNIICARALLRMQIDTASRLLAYTYMDDPEGMANGAMGGIPLKKFKSREGEALTDGYLIDRMTQEYEWVRRVYESTSGDVHFSEKQFFASIASMKEDDHGRTVNLLISQFDTKYPESSWPEIAACFSELCEILKCVFIQYGDRKMANKALEPTPKSGAAEL